MKQLTEKQRQFVSNKATGMTNRDAAVAAGYAVAGAGVAADKLMHHPAIRKALKDAAKTTPPVEVKTATTTMQRKHYPNAMSYLVDVMNHAGLPIGLRVDAAKALLPYQHAKLGETDKKETKRERAAEIARGHGAMGGKPKFATKHPPQLTVVRNE